MSSRMRVAIAGASGTTGSSIVNGLLEDPDKFEVIALTRPASVEKPENIEFAKRGVSIKAVELDGPTDTLAEVLAGMDMVISCLTLLQFQEEMNLITASSKAGVGRYIPSFWAPVCPPRGVMLARETSPKKKKEDMLDHIKRLYLPYTVIDVGWWYQLSLPALPSGRFRPWVEEYSTTRIIGDGNVPWAFTHNGDIGKFVARIITDSRTMNKMVFAYGQVMTQNDAFAILEKVSGETVQRKYLSKQELQDIISKAQTEIANSGTKHGTFVPNLELAMAQYRNLLGVRGDNTPENAKYLGYLDARELYPDVKITPLDAYIKELLEGQ